MIEVGFWRRFEDPNVDPDDARPWPAPGALAQTPTGAGPGGGVTTEGRCWSGDEGAVLRCHVLEYLRRGFVESLEFGYSECRLCGRGGKALGCLSLCDGTHVWPEGLAHYVEAHGTALPAHFVDHVMANAGSLAARHTFRRERTRRGGCGGGGDDGGDDDGGDDGGDWSDAGIHGARGVLLEWNHVEGRPVPAPRRLVEWVTAHTAFGDDGDGKRPGSQSALRCCLGGRPGGCWG